MNAVRWVVLLAVSSGCTAAKAQFQILSAEEGLNVAEKAGTATSAQFEHEMAVLYLDKAREKVNYGEYRMGEALARQSAVWSERAVEFVSRQRQIEVRVEDFTEQAGPPPSSTSALGSPEPEPEPEPENPFAGDDEDIEIELDPAPVPAPAPSPAPAPGPAPGAAPKKTGPKP